MQVTLRCENLPEAQTLLKMPAWEPGYYLIIDPAKNVHDFTVSDTLGNPLKWRKEQKNGWLIDNGAQRAVDITYTVYANEHSVAESNVNEEKAFLSPNTVFLYPDGAIETPCAVSLYPDPAWQTVSTGLPLAPSAGAGEKTYLARNFDVLYDSPIYIGNQLSILFEHEGKSYELAVARPEGFDADGFVSCLKKIITEATTLMGHVPYDHYAFIIMESGGGGLEHWNSQASFAGGSMAFENEHRRNNFLEFITHEYFHLYNVKAIRPIELGPFDYDKECYTNQLWISEGLTVYYSYILMERAGFYSHDDVMAQLRRNEQAYQPYQGKDRMSLARSSYDIWLNFFNWGANSRETTISYYDKGPVVGYHLDMAIREASGGSRSLDDLMRLLYNRFYLEQQRGFTEEEFWACVQEVAGKRLETIEQYVYEPGGLTVD